MNRDQPLSYRANRSLRSVGRTLFVNVIVMAMVLLVFSNFLVSDAAKIMETDEAILSGLGVEPISLNGKFAFSDHPWEVAANDSSPVVTDPLPQNGTSESTDIDYSAVFRLHSYNYSLLTRYSGEDETSEYSSAISISSKYIVVGSHGFDKFTGQVHIYTAKTETTFEHMANINPPAGANINFGVSIDVYDDTIMIGANSVDIYRGEVYMYVLYQEYWVLDATLTSPLGRSEGFGKCVTLYGTSAAVASATEHVFVYENTGNEWKMVSSLEPPEGPSRFGRSIDMYGNTLVVAAPMANNSAGAVFVYNRIAPQSWSLMSTLQSVTGYNSFFGQSVSIYDKTIAVGATGYQNNVWGSDQTEDWRHNPNNTGWVYLYDLDAESGGHHWSQSQAIQSPVGPNSYFGQSVSVNSHFVAVGADGYPNGTREGSAFFYRRNSNTNVSMEIAFASQGVAGEHFGHNVYLSSDYNAVIGSFGYDKLRGAIVLAPLPKKGSGGGGTSGGTSSLGETLSSGNKLQNNLLILLLVLMLAVLVAAVAVYTCGWNICCCCCKAIAPIGKKKKKKEEEDSPYTVHSYVGYSELDDDYSYTTNNTPVPRMLPMPPPAKMLEMEKEKALASGKSIDKKTGMITSATEEQMQQLFPFKVASYRGYSEATTQQGRAASESAKDAPLGDETARNTVANSSRPMHTRYGPTSLPSMQSMTSIGQNSLSQNSMNTSEYFGHDRQIFNEMATLEQIHPGAVFPQQYEYSHYGGIAHQSVTDSQGDDSSQSIAYSAQPELGAVYDGQSVVSGVDAGLFRDRLVRGEAQVERSVSSVATVSTQSDRSDKKSVASYVEQARAQYAAVVNKRPASAAVAAALNDEHSVGSQLSSIDSGSSFASHQSSLVEQAKSQFATLKESSSPRDPLLESSTAAFAHDEQSVVSQPSSIESSTSAASGQSSLVEQARSKYAAFMQKRQVQQPEQPRDEASHDEASVLSGVSTTSSLTAATVPSTSAPSAAPAIAYAKLQGGMIAQARARYNATMKKMGDVDDLASLASISSSSLSGPTPAAVPATTSFISSDSSCNVSRTDASHFESHLVTSPPRVSVQLNSEPLVAQARYTASLLKMRNIAEDDSSASNESSCAAVGASSSLAPVASSKSTVAKSVVANSEDSKSTVASSTLSSSSHSRGIVSAEMEETFSEFMSPLRVSDAVDAGASLEASTSAVSPHRNVEDHQAKAASALAAARQRVLDEEARARLAAQSASAQEDLKRVQERNRLKEETRLRAEEKARARFAMFKAKAEEHAKVPASQLATQGAQTSVVELAKQVLASASAPASALQETAAATYEQTVRSSRSVLTSTSRSTKTVTHTSSTATSSLSTTAHSSVQSSHTHSATSSSAVDSLSEP